MYQLSCPDMGSAAFRRPEMPSQKVQRILEEIKEMPASLFCVCKGAPGAPLALRRVAGTLHPVRVNGTANQHRNGCPHSEIRNLAAAYGAPHGAFSDRNGVVHVNFNLLFSNAESGGSGGGKRKMPDRGPALLSLAWLLSESGLNIWHPQAVPAEPFRDLWFGARQIQAALGTHRMSLDEPLLLPQASHPKQLMRNRQKLRDGVTNNHPVLVAAILPAADVMANGERRIDLKLTLGVPVKIYESTLGSALNKFTHASARWKRGEEVLMLGIAQPSTFNTPTGPSAPFATLRHLALLPVSAALTPLPTPILEREFLKRKAAHKLLAVGPEDDSLLAQLSGRALTP